MVSYKQSQHVSKTDVQENAKLKARQMGTSLSNQAMLNFMGMNENAGSDSALSEDMRARLEQNFGYSLSSLKVKESREAAKFGGKAVTKGNVIHFQPGILQERDPQSEKIIAHEVAHAVAHATETRYRTGGEHNVVVDAASERMADRSADNFMSSEYGTAQTATLQPLPMAPASAPVEGWGIGILRNKNGEHEKITEAARKKAALAQRRIDSQDQGGPLETEQAKKSLQYGARFNDVGHRTLVGMGAQMKFLKWDAFVNQTHKGDMQFMHSMDTSSGDTQANAKKIQRYAQFSSDVYQNRQMPGPNGGRMQDMNMLDYALSQNGAGDPFQEMMLSTMVHTSALKKFDKEFAKTNHTVDPAAKRQQRTAGLRNLLTFSDQDRQSARDAAAEKYANKGRLGKKLAGNQEEYVQKKVAKAEEEKRKNRSKYARGTIGNFFTDGSKDLDAGMVALGSASHMLEDSFAGSHATRSDNLYLGTTRDTELSSTGAEIASKATPIMGNADYTQQDNALLIGRHGKADKIIKGGSQNVESQVDANLRATRGGSLARDSAAQYMLMNARMKQNAQGVDAPAYGGSDLDKFVQGVTKTDDSAVKLGVTGTGRAYDRKFKGKAGSKEAKQGIKEYRKLTKKHIVKNKHTTASERAKQLSLEIGAMEKIFGSGNPEAKRGHRPHATEMLANIQSMISQIQASPKPSQTDLARLIDRRNRLTALLARHPE